MILGSGSIDRFAASAPWAVFPRKRLEISYSDYAHGLYQCVSSKEEDRAEVSTKIERYWSPHGNGFVCLSVRTGFDLYLQALNLPHGSEVLMSAVTIKDMVRIVEHHGLIPIAIDMDEDVLVPSTESILSALTPRTKLLVFAHLFGTIVDLTDIALLCQNNGILFMEDCAEAYAGPSYRGHPNASVTSFSFGTIKTSTALGGCLMTIKDPFILENMQKLHSAYSPRPRSVFTKRIVKCRFTF